MPQTCTASSIQTKLMKISPDLVGENILRKNNVPFYLSNIFVSCISGKQVEHDMVINTEKPT